MATQIIQLEQLMELKGGENGHLKAEVLAAVKGAGFKDAIHVGGGVLAWVSQIEPDKPSY